MRVAIPATVALFLATAAARTIAQQADPRTTVPGTRQTTTTKPVATTLTPADTNVARLLPGTRGVTLSTIQGTALTSSNSALPNNTVRLRDARLGRVLDTTVTDQTGAFAFHTVSPGTYVIEIMESDQTVAATSQLISVDAGEVVMVIVKLPLRKPPSAGALSSRGAAAAAVTAGAATAGILATMVSGSPASGRPIS
jgi:hypothetical protein